MMDEREKDKVRASQLLDQMMAWSQSWMVDADNFAKMMLTLQSFNIGAMTPQQTWDKLVEMEISAEAIRFAVLGFSTAMVRDMNANDAV